MPSTATPRSRPSSSRTCSTSRGSSRASSGWTSSGEPPRRHRRGRRRRPLPAAEAKGVRVVKILDSLSGAVAGDPARLQQMVWNLLSNAVKFTPRGGRIQVLLERVNSHVEITVTDTGHRHQARVPAARLRPVPPGRRHDDATARRAGAGAVDRQATGRDARRAPCGPRAPARARGARSRGASPLVVVHDQGAARRSPPQEPAAGEMDVSACC